MKRYWDYTEKERAAFTREEVEQFLDYELMEKGVIKIFPPKIEPISPDPVMQREVWYEFAGLLFKTAEEAGKVAEMYPHQQGYNWSADYKYQYAKPADAEIKQVTLYVQSEVDALAKTLAKNKQAKEANEKAQNEYNKASQEQDKVLSYVWEDWHACYKKAEKNQRILDTAKEYIRMTENNLDVAQKFLSKVFNADEIAKAEEWFGSEQWPFQIERVA